MLAAPSIDIVLASVIVVLLAGIGFNQPSWSRSFTTALRYYSAYGAHIALYLVAFLAIYALAWRVYAWSADPGPSEASEVKPQLAWLALLVMVAVRAIPYAARRVRRWAHGWADIPDCAHRFAHALAGASFEPGDFDDDARALLKARGIDVGGDWLPSVESAQQQLLSATALFLRIRQWETSSQAAQFVTDARQSIDLLRHRFDRLSFRVSRTLASIERLGDVRHLFLQQAGESVESRPLDDLLRKLFNDLIADIFEDIHAFHADACLIAARGTLAMRNTRQGRDAMVAAMGFRLARKEGRGTFLLLARVALLVVASLWLYFHIMPAAKAAIPAKALFLVITLNLFGAIAIAVIPKRHWGFANSGLWQKTPKWFVFGAGVAAMLLGVLVNLCIGALLGGAAGALRRLQDGSVFLPYLFATAAVVAWLIQDHRWSRVTSRLRRRLYDALSWGVAWMAASLVSMSLIILRNAFSAEHRAVTNVPIADPLVALLVGLGVSFLFAAVLGYFIPELVRARDAPRPQEAGGDDLLEFVPKSLRQFVP